MSDPPTTRPTSTTSIHSQNPSNPGRRRVQSPTQARRERPGLYTMPAKRTTTVSSPIQSPESNTQAIHERPKPYTTKGPTLSLSEAPSTPSDNPIPSDDPGGRIRSPEFAAQGRSGASEAPHNERTDRVQPRPRTTSVGCRWIQLE